MAEDIILSPGDAGFEEETPPIPPTTPPPIAPPLETPDYKLGDNGIVNADGTDVLSTSPNSGPIAVYSPSEVIASYN